MKIVTWRQGQGKVKFTVCHKDGKIPFYTTLLPLLGQIFMRDGSTKNWGEENARELKSSGVKMVVQQKMDWYIFKWLDYSRAGFV